MLWETELEALNDKEIYLKSDHGTQLVNTVCRELPRKLPRRKLPCICALFKAYSGERAWKPIGDRLERPHYLSRVDHERKIRSRRQRMDIGKYSFVNRTVQHWNQLPAEVLRILPCKPITFKKRVRKVIIELN
jgi:hypothetical protein